MEYIGFIRKQDLHLNAGLNCIEGLVEAIEFGERNEIELIDDVVQVICAGCVMTKTGRVLTINKYKKSVGDASPEKGKTLLYIGGHLDKGDNKDGLMATFKACMKREIFEETKLEISDNQIGEPIVVYSPTPPKSSKHFGIVFPVYIESHFEANFLDGEAKFLDCSELDSVENYEDWSQIIKKMWLK